MFGHSWGCIRKTFEMILALGDGDGPLSKKPFVISAQQTLALTGISTNPVVEMRHLPWEDSLIPIDWEYICSAPNRTVPASVLLGSNTYHDF